MKRVLVVCTHNSSLSQMAEGYLRFFASHLAEAYSAGCQPMPLHPLAVAAMADDNIDISQQVSQGVDDFTGQAFDYLITVGDDLQTTPVLSRVQATTQVHFSIPEPPLLSAPGEEALAVEPDFLGTRELVKKQVLRFVGQRLIAAPDPVA